MSAPNSVPMRGFFRTYPLISFFFLAFVLAWGVWLPILFWELPPALIWLAGIAPISSGLLVTYLVDGLDGMRGLGTRLTSKGLTLHWILIASFLPLGLRFVSMTFDFALRVSVLPLFGLALLKGIAYAPVALFEEVGWRGFALPRLLDNFPPLVSAHLLGLIWAVWHLPLWALNAFLYADMSLFWWTVDCIVVSVLLTWMVNHSAGNLWLPCLFHGIANMTAQTLPLPGGSITGSLVGVAAALVVLWIGKEKKEA